MSKQEQPVLDGTTAQTVKAADNSESSTSAKKRGWHPVVISGLRLSGYNTSEKDEEVEKGLVWLSRKNPKMWLWLMQCQEAGKVVDQEDGPLNAEEGAIHAAMRTASEKMQDAEMTALDIAPLFSGIKAVAQMVEIMSEPGIMEKYGIQENFFRDFASLLRTIGANGYERLTTFGESLSRDSYYLEKYIDPFLAAAGMATQTGERNSA